MKLEIDSEKVKALAKKCPQWEQGLMELFPEAFVMAQKKEELQPPLHVSDFKFTISHDYPGGLAILWNSHKSKGEECEEVLIGWVVPKGREAYAYPRRNEKRIELRDMSLIGYMVQEE